MNIYPRFNTFKKYCSGFVPAVNQLVIAREIVCTEGKGGVGQIARGGLLCEEQGEVFGFFVPFGGVKRFRRVYVLISLKYII